MIKHIDKERVGTYLFITVLFNFPLIYYIISKFVSIIGGAGLSVFLRNPGLLIYFLIMIFFTNYMRHIIMESNFEYFDQENEFIYKTLLWRKSRIEYRNIKKIIICKETLAFKGIYESIIIIRKGCRRNIFFQEYSMDKDNYKNLKSLLKSHDNVKIEINEHNYIKPLLALLSF